MPSEMTVCAAPAAAAGLEWMWMKLEGEGGKEQTGHVTLDSC